jgi:hypothetical protein
MTRGILLLILLTVTFPGALRAQKNCVLRKDKDSIKVYTCDPAQSKFKFITASFTVNARLSQLVAMLLDISRYGDWQYRTINPHLLKKLGEGEIVYYVEIGAPWPVSNRDMVNHLTVTQDRTSKTVTITANSVPDFIPHEENLVRVPSSASTWVIVPLSSSRLRVTYSIQIDPGGYVPAWMVNMVSAQAPYESFKNIRDKIRGRSFDPKTVSFITDY